MIKNIESRVQRIIFPLILSELKNATKNLLEEKEPTIVGVTGSVGKSSFIYLLDALMQDRVNTKTTFKGNSETGLPLEILGIRDYLRDYRLHNWLLILAITRLAYLVNKLTFDYDLVIAEMGIDSSQPPKNMSYLLEMIKPSIGVFLSVSNVHSQQFSEELGLGADKEAVIRAIAHEKGKIVTEASRKSKAVVNIDSPYIQELIPQIQAELTTFGQSEKADYRLVDYSVLDFATQYIFEVKNEQFMLSIPGYILSEEYGLTIISVLATAVNLGIPLEEAIEKLESKFVLPPGRASLLKTAEGATLIDSSYNSSPIALSAMLDALREYPVEGRRILILGDMRELGPLAEEAHLSFVDTIAELADEVILIGPLMKKFVYEKLKSAHLPVYAFANSEGVGEFVKANMQLNSTDVLLVKGSQNTIFLEQVVKELMVNPENAAELLCRQSPYWEKIRKKFFLS